jgi:hypothetical protein
VRTYIHKKGWMKSARIIKRIKNYRKLNDKAMFFDIET